MTWSSSTVLHLHRGDEVSPCVWLCLSQSKGTMHYGLVIVGHSLGAGTAAILSFLLRPQYPTLHCYSYSPPGGLLRWVYPSMLCTVKQETILVTRWITCAQRFEQPVYLYKCYTFYTSLTRYFGFGPVSLMLGQARSDDPDSNEPHTCFPFWPCYNAN